MGREGWRDHLAQEVLRCLQRAVVHAVVCVVEDVRGRVRPEISQVIVASHFNNQLVPILPEEIVVSLLVVVFVPVCVLDLRRLIDVRNKNELVLGMRIL